MSDRVIGIICLVGIWSAGVLVGVGFGGMVITHQCAHVTQQIQVLQAHGILVNVSDNGDMWGWDERHKVSYQIDRETLAKMAIGKE